MCFLVLWKVVLCWCHFCWLAPYLSLYRIYSRLGWNLWPKMPPKALVYTGFEAYEIFLPGGSDGGGDRHLLLELHWNPLKWYGCNHTLLTPRKHVVVLNAEVLNAYKTMFLTGIAILKYWLSQSNKYSNSLNFSQWAYLKQKWRMQRLVTLRKPIRGVSHDYFASSTNFARTCSAPTTHHDNSTMTAMKLQFVKQRHSLLGLTMVILQSMQVCLSDNNDCDYTYVGTI